MPKATMLRAGAKVGVMRPASIASRLTGFESLVESLLCGSQQGVISGYLE